MSEFAIGPTDDDTPASGLRADAVSWRASFGSPQSPPWSVTKPRFNTADFCAAAITCSTRSSAHLAVGADEVLWLLLTRRGGQQPLCELLAAHAFVAPEHAAVGGDGQVRNVGLDRLYSIQMLMRLIIDCPWFCLVIQHRWNNPALPGHSPPCAGVRRPDGGD
ncbi:hypothetical protein VDR43_09360 [Xanthomonas campestris pv. campestris]|nr:hypothetical protein [Xanthomonas campestris pv. campestris]